MSEIQTHMTTWKVPRDPRALGFARQYVLDVKALELEEGRPTDATDRYLEEVHSARTMDEFLAACGMRERDGLLVIEEYPALERGQSLKARMERTGVLEDVLFLVLDGLAEHSEEGSTLSFSQGVWNEPVLVQVRGRRAHRGHVTVQNDLGRLVFTLGQLARTKAGLEEYSDVTDEQCAVVMPELLASIEASLSTIDTEPYVRNDLYSIDDLVEAGLIPASAKR